jgi:predicted SnoaL-like aldol condensation-catalyzing enzyme
MASELGEKNKALVLRAFDTLFNKRDYATAEQFWSPKYIQHSAHIAPGREGLFDLVKSLPSAHPQIGSLPTSYALRADCWSNIGM